MGSEVTAAFSTDDTAGEADPAVDAAAGEAATAVNAADVEDGFADAANTTAESVQGGGPGAESFASEHVESASISAFLFIFTRRH